MRVLCTVNSVPQLQTLVKEHINNRKQQTNKQQRRDFFGQHGQNAGEQLKKIRMYT